MLVGAVDHNDVHREPSVRADDSVHEAAQKANNTAVTGENVGPAALARASGAGNETGQVPMKSYPEHGVDASSLSARTRQEWATTLAHILGNVHRAEAVPICAAYVDSMAAGMPELDPFGDIRVDAEYWAVMATEPELEAYFSVIAQQIPRRNFAERARKRLLVSLWNAMPVSWRKAFLCHVDPEGRWRRRAI